jgi:hypothetical protein
MLGWHPATRTGRTRLQALNPECGSRSFEDRLLSGKQLKSLGRIQPKMLQ